MLCSKNAVKFVMRFQLKLLVFLLFLVLTLSLCHGKNVTVKVVGVIHCTDCIRQEFTTTQTTSDIKVSIHCKSKNRETNTHAKTAVDKEGNFNLTLSSEIRNNEKSIDGCFAKLQSTFPDQCPIQSPQTASVKLLGIDKTNVVKQAQNNATVIKFSPTTCQSDFFWPFITPTITYFPTLSPTPKQPPLECVPPPSEVVTPPPPQDLQYSPPVSYITPPAPGSELPYSPFVSSFPPPPPPAPTSWSPQSPPDPTFNILILLLLLLVKFD